MKDFSYLIQNFFTHKDYLVSADLIPGTLFTPLHYVFSAILLTIVIASAVYVSKHKNLMKPVFASVWAFLVVFEVVIITWESVSGKTVGLDLQSNLSLYPCSLFLYTMPFAIWGKGIWKKMACGYVCTLGLLGSSVNFFYPAIRLSSYSCISFVGFHTFLFHGSMLFTCLAMLFSDYHRYNHAHTWQDLFLPCIPTLLLSIPANIVNYTLDADYMFFRGKFPLVGAILSGANEIQITLVIYILYILVPAMFYLPSYILRRRRESAEFLDLYALQ